MVDVFISYSRANQAVVRRLAEAVKREGYSVWWDDELPPHLSYGDVITEKIGAARAAIVVWSNSAAESEWVRAEADVARGQKKLIQTSVDDRMPPMPFNQIQFASIGDWRGEADHPGWRKVKASLTALCGPGAAAAPAALPAARPMPAEPRQPAPRTSNGQSLLIAIIGVSLLVVAGVAALAWMRSEPPTASAPADRPSGAQTTPPAATRENAATRSGPALPSAGDAGTGSSVGPEPDEILPDSSERLLGAADLEGLSRDQLRLARNEIFARRGRIFRDPALPDHFERYSWYRPQAGEVALGPIESANVRLLQEAESW
jgi:TIR domain/YARHG domain